MLFDDIDFGIKFASGSIKLSDLMDTDINEIKSIANQIMKEKHFKSEVQALIAAYYLFVDAYIETNQEAEEGRKHH